MPDRPNPKLFGLAAILLAKRIEKQPAAAAEALPSAAEEDRAEDGNSDAADEPPDPGSDRA
jgi:hypothetical protein